MWYRWNLSFLNNFFQSVTRYWEVLARDQPVLQWHGVVLVGLSHSICQTQIERNLDQSTLDKRFVIVTKC